MRFLKHQLLVCNRFNDANVGHTQGKTWNLTATPTDMFPGRLAAPRFVQYGQNFADAPDNWVYVYFPGRSEADSHS